MEIVLEVPDKDAARVLELLKGIKRVKVKSPAPARAAGKARVLAELKESLEYVRQVERGELPMPTRSLEDLLNELDAEAAAPSGQS